eukprot:296379-Pelagomonas_calceolata.AAC.1
MASSQNDCQPARLYIRGAHLEKDTPCCFMRANISKETFRSWIGKDRIGSPLDYNPYHLHYWSEHPRDK